MNMRKFFFFLATVLIIVAVGRTYNLIPDIKLSDYLKKLNPASKQSYITLPQSQKTVVSEESVVIKVVEDTVPSVVTVGIMKTTQGNGYFEFNPFDPFGGIRRVPGQAQKIDENIGSGFIVSSDGLIITNKHVVSDTEATYKVLSNEGKQYNVEEIYRDPLNDLAILKINASNLKPLPLGDSGKLKLGQMAVAIGTPLGEFTNTVTTGIISGLGRGITAGSPYEGFVEKLDNVIQTSAALSPGNSGGPLLNSSGEVIGVNTAIAQGGQNIAFAIPVNVVKELLDNFQKRGGTFERPYLGVRYQMVDRKTAIMNSLPEGAYIESVVEGSPAEKAEIKPEDIIVEVDGQKITSAQGKDLASRTADLKIGQTVDVKLWRDGEQKTVKVTVEAYKD
jgi:S1-C subfamily serine protease